MKSENLKTVSLPGISRIYLVDGDLLPARTDLCAIVRRPVPVMTKLTPVSFTGVPVCELTTQRINRGSKQTATLTFVSLDVVEQDGNVAFVIVTPEGDAFLIGSRERPVAALSAVRTTGDPAANAAATTYTVTHTALRTLVPCHIVE